MICPCPGATALTAIPAKSCPSDFDQIQKLAFQRIYKADGTKNVFVDGTNDIDTKASWTAFMAAADSTKIVVTPFVENPTPSGGDAVTYGGGNETVGGVEKIIGRNPVMLEFALNQYLQSIIAAMKPLQCEENLGVYLFNGQGQIACLEETISTTKYHYPIPIRSLFVGDWMPNGLNTPDSNVLRFGFAPNYSDKLVFVNADDFNPLDLNAA